MKTLFRRKEMLEIIFDLNVPKVKSFHNERLIFNLGILFC